MQKSADQATTAVSIVVTAAYPAQQEHDDKRAQTYRDWAIESGNRLRLTAMQALLEPRVEFRVEELDANRKISSLRVHLSRRGIG
jgi:hypothetical protein